MHKETSRVLEFWFGEPESLQAIKKWWKKDPEFDAHIQTEFGDLLERAKAGKCEAWTETPEGKVALIVLLDQFSRNIFRDQARAFDADPQSLEISLGLIDAQEDQNLTPLKRWMAYMPLMHAEDLDMQNLCIQKFKDLIPEVSNQDEKSAIESGLDFAIRHRDVILSFGRFPHRNEILSRPSNAEEQNYLSKEGSGF